MENTMDWHEVYRLAVVETDARKMPQRISAARLAIHRTLQELALNGKGPADREELETALDRLVLLETDTASWPKRREA
jgi:hypothetical protein